MSFLRRFELLDPSTASSLLYKEFTILAPRPSLLFPYDDLLLAEERAALAMDILSPDPFDLPLHFPSPHTVGLFGADLLPLEPYGFLRGLAGRVQALDLADEQPRDRKYKWTTEIKGGKADRKYSWVTKVDADGERNVKWLAEVKGKGKDAVTRTYGFQASSALAEEKVQKKGNKAAATTTKIVEITEPEPEKGAVVMRKAFAKRAATQKGKKKELSPQEAAYIIQVEFRQYLIRRSQVLRSLRELAVAKAKLKEIRVRFSNFSYRHRILKDSEERQKFSERIIVLLLTVDAIEGPDYIVRSARKSMINELEAILDVVDPHPPGRLNSLRRRRFDLPDASAAAQELALGVSKVIELINEEA